MNSKKIKKIFMLLLATLAILFFGYFLRYSKYYIEKIYDYKIEQAEKFGDYIKSEEFYKKKNHLS